MTTRRQFIQSLPVAGAAFAVDGNINFCSSRKQEGFDSIHPSLMRQSVLNMNYGLYEVMPGI